MNMFDPALDRRTFLQASGLGLTSLLLPGVLSAAEEKPAQDPYRGFRMGIQSYSLRGYKVDKALEVTEMLGLKVWEAYPAHVPMTTVPKQVAEAKAALSGAKVTLMAYGVLGFDGNETKAREAFDFAKAIGIETLSANPQKNDATFKLLDKLVEEYEINIAIHNHGPNAMYDKIDDVVNMVKDHHPRIGACVDTGHYLRSSEDPVEAIERLKGRVFGVHLKDVKDAKIFKILGEGDLDVPGCLKALHAQKYQHALCLEYEENPSNPVSDIEACLRHVRKSMTVLD